MSKYTLQVPANILKASLLASANFDVRQYLNGVNINIEKKEFQATDGHILTKIKSDDVKWDNESQFNENIWIDRTILENFLKLCKYTKKQNPPMIKITLDENDNVILENTETKFSLRTNENQKYFDGFERVVCRELAKDEFTRAILNLDLLEVYRKILSELRLTKCIEIKKLYGYNTSWQFTNTDGNVHIDFIMMSMRD